MKSLLSFVVMILFLAPGAQAAKIGRPHYYSLEFFLDEFGRGFVQGEERPTFIPDGPVQLLPGVDAVPDVVVGDEAVPYRPTVRPSVNWLAVDKQHAAGLLRPELEKTSRGNVWLPIEAPQPLTDAEPEAGLIYNVQKKLVKLWDREENFTWQGGKERIAFTKDNQEAKLVLTERPWQPVREPLGGPNMASLVIEQDVWPELQSSFAYRWRLSPAAPTSGARFAHQPSLSFSQDLLRMRLDATPITSAIHAIPVPDARIHWEQTFRPRSPNYITLMTETLRAQLRPSFGIVSGQAGRVAVRMLALLAARAAR